jgi:hypothetical protein
MGTPLVKSTKEKEKDKEKVREKAREKEERKREKRLLKDQEREQERESRELQLVPAIEDASDKGKERETDLVEQNRSRELEFRPIAMHRSMEREGEMLRERLREQDRANGVDPREKYRIKEGGKRWSLTNLRRSHVLDVPTVQTRTTTRRAVCIPNLPWSTSRRSREGRSRSPRTYDEEDCDSRGGIMQERQLERSSSFFEEATALRRRRHQTHGLASIGWSAWCRRPTWTCAHTV